MKITPIVLLTGLIAIPAWAADPAAEVKAAVQQLASQPNYSWTSKSESVQPQGGGPGGPEGQRRPRGEGGQDGQPPPAGLDGQPAPGGPGAPGAQGGPDGQRGQRGQRGQGQGGPGGRFGGGGPGGFGGGGGAPDGKLAKGGFTLLMYRMGDNTMEAVLLGNKVAIKDGDEWKTADEISDSGDAGGGGGRGGGRGRGGFLVRRAQQFKAPAAEAQELVGRVTGLKRDGDSYVGEMTPEAIKQMFTFRGRGGGPGGPGGQGGQGGAEGEGPDTSNIKGTVKFWVKNGLLAKYETHVEGKMIGGRDGREFDINRTTIVEIKDVGTTRVDVAPEARKKLRV